eukprot:836375-Rhodomonas_salina.1
MRSTVVSVNQYGSFFPVLDIKQHKARSPTPIASHSLLPYSSLPSLPHPFLSLNLPACYVCITWKEQRIWLRGCGGIPC